MGNIYISQSICLAIQYCDISTHSHLLTGECVVYISLRSRSPLCALDRDITVCNVSKPDGISDTLCSGHRDDAVANDVVFRTGDCE